MTLYRWAGLALGLLLILGCSSSAAAQPSVPGPPEIRATWTPVLTPDGYDAYVTGLCFDHNWVVMGYIEAQGGLSVAYGGTRC